jgi:hypothetical protein
LHVHGRADPAWLAARERMLGELSLGDDYGREIGDP